MALAARSLEQSLFAMLKADTTLTGLLGGAFLYDEPRRDHAFPYLTLLTAYSRDWSTGTETGDEHRLMITVWTASEDRARQQDLLAHLQSALADPALTLTGHRLVNWRIERAEIRPDRKNRLLQGVLQIRAVTETTA